MLDIRTNQGIAGAHISIPAVKKNIFTDQNGFFCLTALPAGSHNVVVSYVGFSTLQQNVVVPAEQNAPIQFWLEEATIHLSDVEINGTASRAIHTLAPVDIKLRPINTSQDVLRMIPGLFIAQHAGGGKAEQIFLRGFDIDHGTDINLEVDGLPVNMVSHAHGQGYSDLHFVIPELIQLVDFDKGPYYADKGNFTTAGYASFQTKNVLEQNFVKLEGGQFGHGRLVAGVNFKNAKAKSNNNGYIATELFRSDGYFESPQDFKRLNIQTKYSIRKANDLFTIGGTYFTSNWYASGQIPQRAVDNNLITRFGAIDDTEGGNTSRTNVFVKHVHTFTNGNVFEQQAYASQYTFNLYSNFTFFLNDPVDGDQIQQEESRWIYGYRGLYTAQHTIGTLSATGEIGGGLRLDQVNDIALSNTIVRRFRSPIQRGDVNESNFHLYANETLQLTDKLSVNAAVRYDYFTFQYNNQLNQTTKKANASIVSPKLNITYKVNDKTSVYIKSGTGFHSNDSRVVLEQTGRDILPRAIGVDVGIHTKLADKLLLQAAVWRLDMEQEFVYVGDAGIVEPSGRTQRQGIDLTARYGITDTWFADIDLSFANPKAKDVAESENRIPLAPTFTSIGGITYNNKVWSASLRYRYMTDRPANETNTVVAQGYLLADAIVNYKKKNWEAGISIENLFNQEWEEAQFDTESRLQNETEPVSEIHYTPGIPFFARLRVTYFF